MTCVLEKNYCRGEHCSPETPPSSLRLATSSVEEALSNCLLSQRRCPTGQRSIQSPLKRGMPERAGGYIILGLTPETRSAESLVSLAVRLGLANAFFAFSCMCCVDILGVCFEDCFCFFTAFAALVSFLLSCAKFTRRVYSSFFLC